MPGEIECEWPRRCSLLIAMAVKSPKTVRSNPSQLPMLLLACRPRCRSGHLGGLVQRLQQAINLAIKDIGVLIRVPVGLSVLIVEGQHGTAVLQRKGEIGAA